MESGESEIVIEPISAIVPTIGRPESLRRLLRSIASQSKRVMEVIVADGSSGRDTAEVANSPEWISKGLSVRRIVVYPPNAVRQREAAIENSSGDLLLLLDDDVELEPDCVEQMLVLIRGNAETVAVVADFSNQRWPQPTRAWRFYLRNFFGMKDESWQGRVVGPLLRFGFDPVPLKPVPMEWLGTCNSVVRRTAFDKAGGFSSFFMHRCTMNEDVDLGLKIAQYGTILFCPQARMAHYHDPGGRVSPVTAAEDDLYNRYMIMRKTMKRSRLSALFSVFAFTFVESVSNGLGAIRHMNLGVRHLSMFGRIRGLGRIAMLALK